MSRHRPVALVQARPATPVFDIVLCGLVGLGALFLDVATSTSFITFGAFTAFTLVNLSVIGYFGRHRPCSTSWCP